MIVATVLAFCGIFAVAALLLSLPGAKAAEEKKRATMRLDSMMADFQPAKEDLPDLRRNESLSSIPFLNRWLISLDIAPKLRDLLSQANLSWTPLRLLLMCTAASVIPGYLVYLRSGVFLVSGLAGAALGSIPFWYVFYMRQKRFDQFEQGLPAALDLMVSGLRSGHSLVSALNLVAREVADPIGREFRICFEEQNYGLELRNALENMAGRVPIQDVRIVITAIMIQKETGGNLAEVLDKCAQVIRERFRLKKEIRVRTAQGRLTGLILTLLPLVLGFLMFLANPKHMSLLWTNPMGLKMLYSSVLMTCIGGLIIRRIVRVRV
jgi:tight adherence protein B